MKCYYCGNEANNREHIPPKQMFKNFVCDKITVTSCDEHNTCKSDQDEAIIKGMIYSLNIKKKNMSLSVQKAIDIALPRFKQVKKLVYPSKMLNDEDVYNPELAYISNKAEFDNWIRKISVGLIYNAIGYYEENNDYKNIFIFDSTYYNSPDTGMTSEEFLAQYKDKQYMLSLLENLNWENGWVSGRNNYPKELYYFKIAFFEEFVMFRHHFYENFLVYCGIKICKDTKDSLLKKLRLTHASTL